MKRNGEAQLQRKQVIQLHNHTPLICKCLFSLSPKARPQCATRASSTATSATSLAVKLCSHWTWIEKPVRRAAFLYTNEVPKISTFKPRFEHSFICVIYTRCHKKSLMESGWLEPSQISPNWMPSFLQSHSGNLWQDPIFDWAVKFLAKFLRERSLSE